MNRTSREPSLDGLRGIACLAILLIHTVFYSGERYLPAPISSYCLLIDVPLFFYISGRVTRLSSGKYFGLPGVWRLLKLYYLLLLPLWVSHCIFIHRFDFSSLLHWMAQDYVNSTPFFVVMGSMWFAKCYVVCCPLGHAIDRYRAPGFGAWLALMALAISIGFPHSAIAGVRVIEFIGRHNLDTVWECCFYSTFVWLGVLEEKSIRSAAMWTFSVVLALGILSANGFGGAAWIGNLQVDKFPPNLYYWSYSLLSIGVLRLAVWGAPAFRRLLEAPALQWLGRNALYLYFAQGFSSSALNVYARHSGRLPLWPRVGCAFVLNLSAAVLLTWAFRGVAHMRRLSARQPAPVEETV